MTATLKIRERVDAFVNDLDGLIRDAIRERFHSAIGEPAAAGAGRPKKAAAGSAASGAARRSRPKGAKRTPDELRAVEDALLSFIQKNPGKRIEEINRVIGLPTSELSRPLGKLIAGRKVRRTGQKRASRYFPR